MTNIELLIQALKSDKLFGKLFIPDDDFYNAWNSDDHSLQTMFKKLLDYTGIEAQNLKVSFYDNLQSAGLYVHDGSIKTIFVNSCYRNNVFEVSAILAHELMHYYLIEKKNILLPNMLENEILTDFATISAGLGIVVLNSFYHYFGWHEMIIGASFGKMSIVSNRRSFGYFNPFYYGKLYKKYIKEQKINKAQAFGHILPTSRIFLGIVFHKGIPKNELPLFIKLKKSLRTLDFLNRLVMIVLIVPLGIVYLVSRFVVSIFQKVE